MKTVMNQIPTTGTLYIYSSPPGADIYIDDRRLLDGDGNPVTTPAIVTDIPQGSHTIRFTMIEYRDDVVETSVVGGYASSVYGVLYRIRMPYRPTTD